MDCFRRVLVFRRTWTAYGGRLPEQGAEKSFGIVLRPAAAQSWPLRSWLCVHKGMRKPVLQGI